MALPPLIGITTTNWHYHQYLCLEAWHINFTHAPLNCDDGSLLPDAYLTSLGKRQLNSDCVKGPLVVVFRSPLMKALDRSVKMLDLWIVTSLVTFIKSVNQNSIKPCLTESKVDTQDTILYCLCRLLLKVFSIMQFWVVAIIKSLSVTFWKLSSKLQQWDLKHLEML